MKPIRNVLWSLGGLGTRTIIQALYFILLARVLGPKEYGAFSASLAIIYIFVPFSAWGAGSILAKNVSRDRSKFNDYWGFSLISLTIFGSVFFFLTLILYYFFLSDKIDLFPVLLLCMSEIFFGKIVEISIQAFQSFELIKRTATIQFIYSVIKLLFILLFIYFIQEHSINTWVPFYLASSLITATFCLIIIRIELGRARFSLVSFKNALLEGFYFSLSLSSQTIYNDFDKGLLPKYETLEITGNYSVAYRIIDVFCIPIRAILHAFYAKFFQKGENGLLSSTEFSYKFSLFFFIYGVIVIILLSVFSRYLPIILGKTYEEIVNIIPLLSPIIIFRAFHSLGADTLTGAGMQGTRSVAQITVAIINIILCFILIPMKGWVGAAFASLISDGILAILVWVIIFSSLRASKFNTLSKIDKGG